jgi:N-acetylglucosamine kinase-like BadF-type ATPase
MHVIGIDAGGTKTVCQLSDEQGRLVKETRGPGANLQSAGELQVEKVLHDLMERAIDSLGVTPAAICLGIAGVDREEDARVVWGILRRIGYKARLVIVNDALIALEAGVGDQPGVVIISGTGSIAYGRNAQRQAARAGGWGYVLGDEGSGYWIGRAALRAVLREADRRAEPTALTPLLLKHFDVDKPSDLLHAVYFRGVKPPEIAALAPYVQQSYEEGDRVAAGILDGTARELTASSVSVASRLGMLQERFTFVLAGGIFRGLTWVRDELTERLSAAAPNSEVQQLQCEAASGAVLIALREARGGANIPEYIVD